MTFNGIISITTDRERDVRKMLGPHRGDTCMMHLINKLSDKSKNLFYVYIILVI